MSELATGPLPPTGTSTLLNMTHADSSNPSVICVVMLLSLLCSLTRVTSKKVTLTGYYKQRHRVACELCVIVMYMMFSCIQDSTCCDLSCLAREHNKRVLTHHLSLALITVLCDDCGGHFKMH